MHRVETLATKIFSGAATEEQFLLATEIIPFNHVTRNHFSWSLQLNQHSWAPSSPCGCREFFGERLRKHVRFQGPKILQKHRKTRNLHNGISNLNRAMFCEFSKKHTEIFEIP